MSIIAWNPKLLIEVMSRDKDKDLVEKWAGYRTLPSIVEYLVLGQNPSQPEANIFRRRTGWEPEVVTEGSLLLESVGLQVELAELYKL